MIRDGNLHSDLIALFVGRLRPATYLELGVHNNETMGKVQQAAEGTRLLAVDRKEPYGRLPGVEYYIMDTQAFLKERLPTLTTKLGLVFIDADHRYESVKADFEAVWPYVEEQGLVLLHDTFPEAAWEVAPGYAGDSWRFAVELRARNVDSVTLPFWPGLTIVRKREKGHLTWMP